MPYERKRKSGYARKRYKKRRPRRGRRTGTVSLGLGSNPFPRSVVTTHRYNESFTLDPPVGAPAVAYYSCNGLFDPTVAIGGHQPLGFDQMTPMYDHYTVLGAKATVRFFSNGSNLTTGSMMVYCYVNDDSAAVLTYDTVLEQSKGVVSPLTNTGAKGVTTLTQKFSAKKFFGVADVKDNSQLKGSDTANPTEGAYFVIGAQGVGPGLDPLTIYCNVTIDYITQWSERRDLAQS